MRHIINFNELTDNLKKDLLQLIEDELKNKYPELNTNNIEGLLEDLKELLPSEEYRNLKNKIEQFIQYKCEGKQKMEGRLLDIPPLKKDNREDFKFDYDVLITGLHLNQTGWKKEDRFDLVINKNKIIDNVTIKEIGEHKYFNTYYPVIREIPISFILHNNSGNSRQVVVDLEYIKGKLTPIIPPSPKPEEPSTPDIPDANGNEDIPIIIPAGRMNQIGYIDIDDDIEELIIEGDFRTITGAKWPDLNLIYYGDGIARETFGYNSTYCNTQDSIVQTNLPACMRIEYTGWATPVERYVIKKPRKGRWYIEGMGLGARKDSEVTIKVNMDWKLTNIQV